MQRVINFCIGAEKPKVSFGKSFCVSNSHSAICPDCGAQAAKNSNINSPAFTRLISMMCPPEGVGPALCRWVLACRQGLALKQFSAPLPSLCHANPCGFVLRTVGKFSHEFALSGMFQKFLRGINRHLFRRLGNVKPSTTRHWALAPYPPTKGSIVLAVATRVPCFCSQRCTFYSRTGGLMINRSLTIGNERPNPNGRSLDLGFPCGVFVDQSTLVPFG